MLETLRGAIAYMREKQILHKLGVAISIAIIATACYILYHMLQGLDVDDLYSALRDTEIKTVVLAGLCVAAGYFTLTFYDLFALRAIGRDKVPYRVAAFAGFTSYSIGHNVGAVSLPAVWCAIDLLRRTCRRWTWRRSAFSPG